MRSAQRRRFAGGSGRESSPPASSARATRYRKATWTRSSQACQRRASPARQNSALVTGWQPSKRAGSPALLFGHWAQTNEKLHSPALLPLEVMNALLTGVRRGRWDGRAADAAGNFLAPLPISLHSDPADQHRAWDLARRYDNHLIYDMMYVALAERLGEPLVTIDDTLRRRLCHLGLVIGPDEALISR